MNPINPAKGNSRFSLLFSQGSNTKRLVVILVLSFVALSLLNPEVFLTKSYLVNIFYLFPEYGILALGIMLCMISGGIDLSVVAIANLAGILSSMFLVASVPPEAGQAYGVLMLLAATLLAALIGMACGALSATLIAKVGIPAILSTLGVSDLVLGVALVMTRGSAVSNLPPILSAVGTHIIGGLVPVTLVVFALCALVVSFLLRKKTFGFKLYMMGSNPKASLFSGVHNDAVIYKAYITSGALSAMSGLIMCARFNSARADFGTSYTMQAILICVLGGVNPNGGFGTVRGVTLAMIILQMLSSGFNMFPTISNFYRDLIWGLVLILVMVFNYVSNSRRQKKLQAKLSGEAN